MPVRDEGESSTSPSSVFRELSLFRSLLDICRYCTAERAPPVIPWSAWNRTSQIDMQILSLSLVPTRRRTSVDKIYIYHALFLLCRLNNTLIFPSSLYPRHFHFLFPSLFHSGFFLLERAPLGELNILGT